MHAALVARPGCCIRRLARTRAREMQFTRFLRNPSVTATEMASHAAGRTAARAAGRDVVVIQDTSELALGGRRAKASGYGPLRQRRHQQIQRNRSDAGHRDQQQQHDPGCHAGVVFRRQRRLAHRSVHSGLIQSRRSDCSVIRQREYGCFGIRLFRFRDAASQTASCHHPPPGRRNAPPDDRLQRVIQYSRDGRDSTERPRRTGYPAFRGV